MSMPDFSQMTPADAAAAQAEIESQLAAVRKFNIEAFTLLAIALMATGLRTYSRITAVGIRRFQADDYLVLVGATFHAIETALAYCVGEVGKGLANNSMTPEQRASLDPSNPEYHLRVIGSKIQLCGWTSYSVLLWSLKAAMCTFYLRLTDGLEGYRKRIYFGFFFIGASWITVLLNLFLSCRPFNNMWQISPDPGIYCQPAISPALVWVFLSFNVATDLYLISIPLPIFFKASMPLKKKIALISLFSCGLFVVMAATLRVALLVTDPVHGALLAGSWAVRETFVAVIVTNLPMLFPLFKRWLSPCIGTIGSSLGINSHKKSGNSSGKLPTLETFGQGGRRNKKGPRSVHHITNVTCTESEERIVGGTQMKDMSSTRAGASGNGTNSQVAASDSEGYWKGQARFTAEDVTNNGGLDSALPPHAIGKHDIKTTFPRHPGVGSMAVSQDKTIKGQQSSGSIKSQTSMEKPQPRCAGMVPKALNRRASGNNNSGIPPTIRKQVSVTVEEHGMRGVVYGKGNYTSTWPSKQETEPPRRTEYFADHVHQDGYRNVS